MNTNNAGVSGNPAETNNIDILVSGAEALGIRLEPDQLGQFRLFHEELTDWNSRVNLTSITRWQDVQTRHFLDSLSVSLAISPELLGTGSFVDVGSGAGFPGLPLKIAFPSVCITLVEATAKKTAFLDHVTNALGLLDVAVVTGRAESLASDPELREVFDVALARGVAGLAALAELTLPFCRLGGSVIAQKKLGIEDEIESAQKAIETLGGALKEVRAVNIPGLDDPRALVVIEKVRPTPERYPRRPGMPAKRPL